LRPLAPPPTLFPYTTLFRSNPELGEAIRSADLLVHGSAASVVARHHLNAWYRATGKPFGILGVTIETADDELLGLLSKAAFIYRSEEHTSELQSRENLVCRL